jgi:EAL domain-containing protein (putative c-di-GMP-specific phosphodiesterase class I)
MIALLHEAHARVAIEGIECEREALVAIEAKADYLQGFFFAVPTHGLAGEIEGTTILDGLLHTPACRRLAAA